MKLKHLFTIAWLVPATAACSQSAGNVQADKAPDPSGFVWEELADGAWYCEADAPKPSVVNDSKISILRIDPSKFDFHMLSATEHGKKALPANVWADTFGMDIVINAGMYDLSRKLLSKGYLKNGKHVNNGTLYPGYNAMIAFNPLDSTGQQFRIYDLKCTDWHAVRSDYQCYAQGLRMIDCNGEALGWNKKNQSCSMLVTAMGPDGKIYFIFTRSPYTHNEMIAFMLGMPFGLTHAIYMEGGPQTSLYIRIGDRRIEKIGSYVSDTYENDLNNEFRKLPNVIGMKLKKQ